MDSEAAPWQGSHRNTQIHEISGLSRSDLCYACTSQSLGWFSQEGSISTGSMTLPLAPWNTWSCLTPHPKVWLSGQSYIHTASVSNHVLLQRELIRTECVPIANLPPTENILNLADQTQGKGGCFTFQLNGCRVWRAGVPQSSSSSSLHPSWVCFPWR